MRVIPSRLATWAPPQAAEGRPAGPCWRRFCDLTPDQTTDDCDPRVRRAGLLASAPYLETPEGVLRMRSQAEVDRFVFSCHLEGW